MAAVIRVGYGRARGNVQFVKDLLIECSVIIIINTVLYYNSLNNGTGSYLKPCLHYVSDLFGINSTTVYSNP